MASFRCCPPKASSSANKTGSDETNSLWEPEQRRAKETKEEGAKQRKTRKLLSKGNSVRALCYGWRMLRHIDMTGSQYLISAPDFTEVPFLEILVLEGCTGLVEVHPSLGSLKQLIFLNMRNCKSVESIPPFTSLESLKTLNLSLCSRLKMFPKIEGNMESLLELDLEWTSFEELPPPVERLTGLTTLNLTGCSKIVEIPENLNCVESLEQLFIGGTAIRDTSFLVGMKNLKSLSCRGCKGAPRSLLLPASLSSLTSLIDLDLSDCNLKDGDIPHDLSSLISLRELDLSGNRFVRLPESFSQLSKLKTLYLRNCRQLKLVPKKRPLSLEYVHAQDCISLTDYPNQIKELTSVESGKTTVNSLVSFRTWSLYGGVKGVSNSAMSNPFVSIGAGNEIPEWFGYTSTSNPISIPTGDNKWKGVATCAVFSVNMTADVDFSSYWYQISLETDAVRLKPYVYIDRDVYDRLGPSSDLRLTCYEPGCSFPKSGLHEATVVRARFETNNPFVVVQKCGIRLVYEQDAGWFSTDKENFTFQIFTDLNQKFPTSMEDYVGMDSHLNKMLSYLDIGGPDNVRIIGICGMGGIGKTTIAQVVSEMVRPQFEGYSFLENVREATEKQGALHLQQKLLSDLLEINVNVQNAEMGKDIIRYKLCTRRVLIILDDVDQDEQLEALCHREWFGPGSRIIITSRNEHLLSAVDGDEVYKVNPLTDADAFQLFRMKAFKKDQLVGVEFLKLSKEFLKYADGLPLAIEVLGSAIKGRSVQLWSSALDKLKNHPAKKIINVLKLSFDGLEPREKKIFLDIACFFKGWDIHRVTRILQGSEDHRVTKRILEVLKEKSMITLFGRNLWMDNLMQELGREIVRQECHVKPGRRSRLWVPNEIIHVLDQSKATSAIQSISLKGPKKDDVVHSVNDSFSNMDKLRLLKILNVKFSGNIKYLSNKLQYLEWLECPLNSFPSDFQPDNLVELRMPSSRIKQLWKGNKGWRMLRVIDLCGSQYLTSTPDFTQVPDLEILHLEDCTSLIEVHPSLGFLKKLICLNMRNCKSVESIPAFTSLESLKILNLSLCSRLKMFPKIEGNMESLLEIYLGGTSIEELPPSVERLTGLTKLNLTGCSKLVEIPENLNLMESLEQLFIGGTAIRDSSFLVGMKNLKCLFCPGCKGDAPRSLLLPASLSSLTSLIALDLSDCNLMDGDIPDDLSSLISLRELDLSGNCFVRLPESFSQLSNLKTLYLRNCRQLKLVPKKLPLSLELVHAEDCTSLMDYPNQIKVLTSVESGVTTVISLTDSSANSVLRFGPTKIRNKHTEEESVVRLSLSHPVYRKEFSMLSTTFGVSQDNEIPEWFGYTSTSNPISILIGDNKWKGVATCAVFSVNTTTADVDFSNYWYQITLETDAVRLKPFVIDRELEHLVFRSSSDLRLTYYEPSSSFTMPVEFNEATVVRARFETNNPFVVVQKCGIRLAYEQDAVWVKSHLFREDVWIYLNKDQNKAVLLSGWVSWGDKCLNWEKFIPPSEEEYSTQVLRKNIDSVVPRYLEALNHGSAIYKFNLSGSPAWFHNVVGFFTQVVEGTDKRMFRVPIEIPQNLHKCKKWMGFAIQASIAVEEKEDNYRVDLILINQSEKNLNLTTGAEYHNVGTINIECMRSSHDQLLVVYIPRAQLPEALFAETSTTQMLVCFLINSPHVKFRTIGVRVVYQQDIQGFADAIIQCMQKENSLELYHELVVEDWIQLIRLQGGHLEGVSNPKERDSRTRREKEFELYSQKYRNRDWSAPHHIRCYFYGAEISNWTWFMHIKQGNSAEIPLPPNLLDDANWLGIAICAFSRLCPEDQNKSLGRHISDSEYNVVTCRLDCDGQVLHKWRPFTEFDASSFAKDATWFLYLPRSDKWFKSWRQNNMARATFSWSSQYLAVQSCALGLVYNKDVEHLVHTLTSCELP